MPILTDGDITKGWLRNRWVLAALLESSKENSTVVKPHELPPVVRKYAESIAKLTGLPLSEVLKSKPVLNYYRALYDK